MNQLCVWFAVMILVGCGSKSGAKNVTPKPTSTPTPDEIVTEKAPNKTIPIESGMSVSDLISELENLFDASATPSSQNTPTSNIPPQIVELASPQSCGDQILNMGKVTATSKDLSVVVNQQAMNCTNDSIIKNINYFKFNSVLSCQENQGFEVFNNKLFSAIDGKVSINSCKNGLGTIKGTLSSSIVFLDNTQVDVTSSRALANGQACAIITDPTAKTYHYANDCIETNESTTFDIEAGSPKKRETIKSIVSLKNALLNSDDSYIGGSYDVSINEWKGIVSFVSSTELSYKLTKDQETISGSLYRQISSSTVSVSTRP